MHTRIATVRILLPHLAAALGAVILLCAVVRPADAVDKHRAAVSMAQQAAKAFEAGDYLRAIELYRNAWQQDAKPAYLWALARAEQLGGMHEKASDHYRQFVKAPGAEAARVPKAQAYLAEIERARIDAAVFEADKAAREGDSGLAAQMYLDALRRDPTRVELTYKAACAEQQSERWQEAAEHFAAYLAVAAPDAPQRAQAQMRLEAARRKAELVPRNPQLDKPLAAPQAQPGSPVARPSEPGAPGAVTERASQAPTPPPPMGLRSQGQTDSTLAWSVTGGGALLALSGLVLYITTGNDAQSWQRSVAVGPDGKIRGLSYDEALAQAQSINLRMGVAGGLGVVGLASAATGVWLLVRTPSRVVLLPAPGGAQLAWAF